MTKEWLKSPLRSLVHRARKERWQRVLLWGLFPALYLGGRLRLLRGRSEIRRVLVTHFGALGDTLLLTPALRAIANHLPQARITVLVSHPAAIAVLEKNPHVHEARYLRQYDRGSVKTRFACSTPDLFSLFRLYPEVVLWSFLERFDAGVSLTFFEGAARFSGRLFRLSGVQHRIGAYSNPEGDFTRFLAPEPVLGQHWVRVYQEVVALLDAPSCGDGLELSLEGADFEFAAAFLQQAQNGSKRQPLVALHPGGAGARSLKRWSPQRFATLGDRLQNESGCRVILTGSEEEVPLVEAIASGMATRPILAAGRTTLTELGALLRYVELVVTNDTGILHLAEAVGARRVVSIFGPSDHRRIAPRGSHSRVVRSGIECSPCIVFAADDQWELCSRDVKQECLERVSVDEVYRTARAALEAPGRDLALHRGS